ncbi:hypothetical protein [Bosea vaviloviae]|uniref:Uncharacterized protein n=1 Tax=Bosea vaviloviae TaxID=1526658 RepID=A0A1D7U5N0_9HYPH|nr:hypothetical protein [Bosea vaviloviae]AOO82689.1 hypothetical protein BHK69_21580 [Bosea vaviloviae]
MRKLIFAASLALGAATFLPAIAQAAPAFASGREIQAPAGDIQQVQYRDWRYDGRREFRHGPRRYGPPGHAYGRRYGGPPPYYARHHRRYYDRPYYR